MISVLINSADRFNLREDKIRQTAVRFLKKQGWERVELSLAFVGPKKIKDLNRSYRNLDKATSVLSFFQGQESPAGQLILGDVIVCPKVAQVKNLKISFLIIHGIKNLLSQVSAAKNLRTGPGRYPRGVKRSLKVR